MTIISRTSGKLRGKFDAAKCEIKEAASKVKGLLRNAHLFAKGRDQKKKIEKKMYHTVKTIQVMIEDLISRGANVQSKAGQELAKINGVMEKLLPQIKHFLDTNFVAAGKVIHLQIPKLYAIVRGKAGKGVEFGLKWGLSRMRGGFLSAFLMNGGRLRSDPVFCLQAIREHIALFGKPPRVFGFDRGGDCFANVKRAKKLGVKHVGIAPKGKKDWSVSHRMINRIRRERAQVEGSIGTVKSRLYQFNQVFIDKAMVVRESANPGSSESRTMVELMIKADLNKLDGRIVKVAFFGNVEGTAALAGQNGTSHLPGRAQTLLGHDFVQAKEYFHAPLFPVAYSVTRCSGHGCMDFFGKRIFTGSFYVQTEKGSRYWINPVGGNFSIDDNLANTIVRWSPSFGAQDIGIVSKTADEQGGGARAIWTLNVAVNS